MRVRVIPAADLAGLPREDWIDQARSIYVKGGSAYIPVREGYPCSGEIPQKKPYRGRGFYMIGNIAVLHGRIPSDEDLAHIIQWKKPGGIVWISSYHDAERIPDAVLLYGQAGEVRHRESGISFWMDPTRIMFSSGNRIEKARMAGIVARGERIADMFAGIGYFSIPVAKSGADVHAMELNPVAFRYLQKNIEENGVASSVRADWGDCRDLLDGKYDRIIMGHFDAVLMLDAALPHIRRGGTLHVHAAGVSPPDITPILESHSYVGERITTRKVKKIAPHKWHYVLDVMIR